MMSFRPRWYISALLVLLALAVVQPAIAQTKGTAVPKRHQRIPAGKDCSSCHKKLYAEWKAGPHGANDVQCTVCHGEITNRSVMATPSLSTCEGCHGDKVAQVKSDPFMTEKKKTCVTCHPPHALKPHGAPAGK